MKKETKEKLVQYHRTVVNLFEEKERLEALIIFRDELKDKSSDNDLLVEVNNDIKQMQEKISATEAYLESTNTEIDTYIQAIDDITARVAASLYYKRNLTWEEVSQIMGYNDCKSTAIRVIVCRNIKKTNI